LIYFIYFILFNFMCLMVFHNLYVLDGISGCGAVGLSAVMAAKVVGCSGIVAADINPARLQLATVFSRS
jgi:hypothetical protein